MLALSKRMMLPSNGRCGCVPSLINPMRASSTVRGYRKHGRRRQGCRTAAAFPIGSGASPSQGQHGLLRRRHVLGAFHVARQRPYRGCLRLWPAGHVAIKSAGWFTVSWSASGSVVRHIGEALEDLAWSLRPWDEVSIKHVQCVRSRPIRWRQ